MTSLSEPPEKKIYSVEIYTKWLTSIPFVSNINLMDSTDNRQVGGLFKGQLYWWLNDDAELRHIVNNLFNFNFAAKKVELNSKLLELERNKIIRLHNIIERIPNEIS